MTASMGPICSHRPSRLSSCTVLCECCSSGNGHLRLTAGLGSRHLRMRCQSSVFSSPSYPLSSCLARGSAWASFATSTFRLALHKGSCVNPLSPRFLSLACQSGLLLSPLRDKGPPSADNDSSKGTPTLRLSTPQGTAWSCDCSKEGQPILRIKQTRCAAAATCSKYVANPWACMCSCNWSCETNRWAQC